MAGFAFVRFALTSNRLEEDLNTRASNVAHRIGNSVAPSVWEVYKKSHDRAFSEEVTSAILDAEFRDPFVVGVVVYGNFGHIYMGRFRDGSELVEYSEATENRVGTGADLTRYEPIKSGPMTIGNVRVYLTAAPNRALVRNTLIVDAVESITLSVMIVTALFFILRRALVKPMESLGVAKRIVDSLGEAVVVTDRNGEIVDVNPFFCRLFGKERSEIFGEGMPMLVKEGQGEQTLADVWKPKSSIKVWSGDSTLFDGRGREIRVYANVAPVLDRAGNWIYTVTVLQDVEELRRAEDELRSKNVELGFAKDKAEASSRAKDDFLSIMSHELRTPLNPIIGFGEMIQEELEDPELKDQMKVILSSGYHLLRLIESILEYTRLEREADESERSEFDYAASCKQALNSVSLLAGASSLSLSATHSYEGEAFVSGLGGKRIVCDQTKFEQVLLNLVTNAVKFTPSGTVTIRSLLKADRSNPRLRIEVEDTGVGVREEDRSRIFQAFTQVDTSLTRKHEGIGLGLAISMKLVNAMKGQMGCESEYGQGSRFWFEIPVGRAEVDPSASDKGEPLRPSAGARRGILLVEDEENNRLVALTQLERLGYEVMCAENGRVAIEAASSRAFSCILMDLQMPEMDGFVAAETIRSSLGPNRDTPIVAFTAHASSITREECAKHSMDDFLAKPYSIDALQEKLVLWSDKRLG